MTNESALEFLRQHQPLPPTGEASNELLRKFDDVRRYFTCELDKRSVPLLIGALGEGDGHGIYQMVETTLLAYPEDVVIRALRDGLLCSHSSVRYWSAQFAVNYPYEELLPLLCNIFRIGNLDEQIAAVIAIETIGTEAAMNCLKDLLAMNLERPVMEMIEQIIGVD